MTITIKLDPDIEKVVTAVSASEGVSPEQYVAKIVRAHASEIEAAKKPASTGQKNLVDIFAPLRELGLDFSRNPSTGRPVDV